MLLNKYLTWKEVGCDEAGRGCLAGPVFAAAVILPKNYRNEDLQDSKKLNRNQREVLREIIERDAIGFAVGIVNNEEIDTINILQSSFLAMHRALDKLSCVFDHVIVDGNRFKPYRDIPHTCVVKGDGKYMSIAAASILAKTYRDNYMASLGQEYPVYDWKTNKGYPTQKHRTAIQIHGISPYHRKSFQLLPGTAQLSLFT